MYILTLEINQKCNLKCRYFYLGQKNGSQMDMSTAKNAILMAFKKAVLHKDHKLWIDFVGGEAFLDFQMIRKLVYYIELTNQKWQYEILYSVTTNATIFSQDIVEFLVDKGFCLKVSIDGNKEINDRNRIAQMGYSVHDKILENMKYIRQFEEQTGKSVQVTNVITRNNYRSYFNTLVYLTENLGFKMIDTAIDLRIDWTENEMEGLAFEIKRSFTYFLERVKMNKGFYWEFADKVVKFRETIKEKRKKFYACGAGIVSSYIRTDGSIFACPGNLNSAVKLGSIENGFLKEKMYELKEFTKIENKVCEICDIAAYCVECSCMMQNLAVTGDKNQPVPVLCMLRKLMYEIYEENKEIVTRIRMGA